MLLVITDLQQSKGQVLHSVRLHLNVPGWLTDLNVSLNRKLLTLLSLLMLSKYALSFNMMLFEASMFEALPAGSRRVN